jgi:hypothetical protein
MPDAWEIAHGLNWQLDDAAADPDHDGLDNLSEFQIGTDPQTPQNFFRLGVKQLVNNPNSVVLDFYQLPGRSYTIEQTTSLTPPSWSPSFTLLGVTNAGPMSLTNALPPDASRFYRLVISTPR